MGYYHGFGRNCGKYQYWNGYKCVSRRSNMYHEFFKAEESVGSSSSRYSCMERCQRDGYDYMACEMKCPSEEACRIGILPLLIVNLRTIINLPDVAHERIAEWTNIGMVTDAFQDLEKKKLHTTLKHTARTTGTKRIHDIMLGATSNDFY